VQLDASPRFDAGLSVPDQRSRIMTASAASGASCASPMLRDRFLNALDASDHVALRDLARHLQSCTNTLPSTTCVLLGLPEGSTYAVGALAVIKRQS